MKINMLPLGVQRNGTISHTIFRNVDDDASEVAAEKTLTDGSGANLQELYSDRAI